MRRPGTSLCAVSLFVRLTKRSASRVGLGTRVPSQTDNVSFNAVSRVTRWPAEMYIGAQPGRDVTWPAAGPRPQGRADRFFAVANGAPLALLTANGRVLSNQQALGAA